MRSKLTRPGKLRSGLREWLHVVFPQEEFITATHAPHRDAMTTVVASSTAFCAVEGDEFLPYFIVTASARKFWFHDDCRNDFEIAVLNIGIDFCFWEWGVVTLPNAASEEITNSRFNEETFVDCVASMLRFF